MLTTAFLLGLTGSLHCVGMCGVLALQAGRTPTAILLYHTGRIAAYVVLGLLAGVVGRFMALGGWLGWFSITLGLVIILFLLFQGAGRWLTLKFSTGLYGLQKKLIRLLNKQSTGTALGIGLLNGWLPCGLVYSAVVLALVQPDIGYSIMVMMLFGLGTVPALMAVRWFAAHLLKKLPVSFHRIQTTILALTGFLLIWRGASIINLFYIRDTVLCYPLP